MQRHAGATNILIWASCSLDIPAYGCCQALDHDFEQLHVLLLLGWPDAVGTSANPDCGRTEERTENSVPPLYQGATFCSTGSLMLVPYRPLMGTNTMSFFGLYPHDFTRNCVSLLCAQVWGENQTEVRF